MSPETSPIPVGLVGFGTAGAFFHAPIIATTPALRLAAVVSSRHQAIARAHPEARALDSVDALLADPGIRLVVVASPDQTHHAIARAALDAGKHVVVDKPFTRSLQQADDLIALAGARGLQLGVFHNRRWDGDFLTVRACIAQGRLGRVVHFESHFDRFRPQIKPGWREDPEQGDGVLADLGSHLIDQSVQLFGMPRGVTADVTTQRPQASVPDYAHVLLDYGPLRVILHAATLTCARGPRFIVHGDAGSLVKYGMDPQEAALRAGGDPGMPGWGEDDPDLYAQLTRADGHGRPVPTEPGCYQRFYAGVADALLGRAPMPVPATQARQVMCLLEAAQRSAAQGRTVCPREIG